MKKLTDSQIIAKHSPNVRPRAKMELQIVDQLIASAAVAGVTLKVPDYENDGKPYDVKTALFNLDDSRVTVHDKDGKQLGWVYLVFGNDGYDLISDYSLSIEPFLTDCNALASRLEEAL